MKIYEGIYEGTYRTFTSVLYRLPSGQVFYAISLNRLPICKPLSVCERGRPYDDIMPAGSVLNWARTYPSLNESDMKD
jgi:hypothetical protein